MHPGNLRFAKKMYMKNIYCYYLFYYLMLSFWLASVEKNNKYFATVILIFHLYFSTFAEEELVQLLVAERKENMKLARGDKYISQ